MRSFKTTIKICLAVLCTLCLTFNVAIAASFGADAVYNSASGMLEISGTGTQNAQATVMVMPYTTDGDAITADTAKSGNVVFNMANIDSEGEYALEMGLKNSWEGGLYKAVITVGDASSEVWFTYADATALKTAVGKINIATEAEVKSILSSYGSDVGIADAHIAYVADIGEYIYNNKPEGGYNEDTFLKTYTAGLAIVMVQNGEYSLADVANKLSAYIGISIATDVKPYSADVLNKAEALIQKKQLSGTDARAIYDEAIVVAQLNLAETDSAMQQVVTENSKILALDFDGYNALSNDYKKLQVFAKLLTTEFYSAKDYKLAFDNAVNEVKANDNGPSYIGGGNGGSSSGSSGGGFAGGSNIVSNTPVAQTPAVNFTDMSGHWALNSVGTLVAKGVLGGYPDGTFKPENNVTRAEFAKMLATSLNIQATTSISTYSDVDSNDWYAPYVLALSNRGIITGYDGKFNPDGKITRQDAAVMTYRAIKSMLTSKGASVAFADEAKIADYAKEAVKELSSLKIINGYNGNFDPNNNTTRAQAATIICNMLSACGIK